MNRLVSTLCIHQSLKTFYEKKSIHVLLSFIAFNYQPFQIFPNSNLEGSWPWFVQLEPLFKKFSAFWLLLLIMVSSCYGKIQDCPTGCTLSCILDIVTNLPASHLLCDPCPPSAVKGYISRVGNTEFCVKICDLCGKSAVCLDKNAAISDYVELE